MSEAYQAANGRPEITHSEAGTSAHLEVEIAEESPREGMQIESRSIPTSEKIELINRLAVAGLTHIVVGSFVSARWVPQMSDVEEVIKGIVPMPGVRYRALAFNTRGRQRREELTPPLSEPSALERHATRVHLCDIFVRRNVNRRQADEISSWPQIVQTAVDVGAREAAIGVNAAWGSNWSGEFTLDQRMDLLDRQYTLWAEAGIAVSTVWLGDPMGWNAPHVVAEQVAAICEAWPGITTVQLHLHDTRGCALSSAYAALRAGDRLRRLIIDSSLGGVGGCPYCGNGRATGMIPTEDLVHLLERMGYHTGVDLDLLLETSHWFERVVGRPLHSRVANAGACPGPERFYPVGLPLIETLEEAQHFRVGARAYAEARAPWRPGDPLYELVDNHTRSTHV